MPRYLRRVRWGRPQVSTLANASGCLPTPATGLVATQITPPSGNAITVASAPASVCTISGSSVTGVGAGTCTITANQAGNAVYAAAPAATQSFNVTGAAAAGDNNGDVPLPPWAYALLAIGLMGTLLRRNRTV